MSIIRIKNFILAHTCSWYCQNGVHVVECRSTPDWTVERVRADATAMGLHVVDIRPAREASVDPKIGPGFAWGEYDRLTGHAYRISPQRMHTGTAAWLVFCTNIPEEDPPA